MSQHSSHHIFINFCGSPLLHISQRVSVYWLRWPFWFSSKPIQTEETKLSPFGDELRPPQKMGRRAVPGPRPVSALVCSNWKLVPDHRGKLTLVPFTRTNKSSLNTSQVTLRRYMQELSKKLKGESHFFLFKKMSNVKEKCNKFHKKNNLKLTWRKPQSIMTFKKQRRVENGTQVCI